MGAEVFERLATGDVNAPAFGPGLLDERIEERRFRWDAYEVWREVGELGTGRAIVKRLILLLGFEDYFEDGGLAGGVEQGVKRLKVPAEQGQQMLLRRLRDWRLGGGFR